VQPQRDRRRRQRLTVRLLLLLILAGVGAYFTAPTREAHEEAARAFLDARGEAAQQSQGLSLQTMINYVQGMMAGQGRYENYYLLSKYSVDLPGADYLECYGAFTLVRCSVAGGDAPPQG
jgi:hypothetical protein